MFPLKSLDKKSLWAMKTNLLHQLISLFDKVLLSVHGSIRGLFFLVNGYIASKSRGLAVRLGIGR
jgi:hypothetical protein